MTGKNHVIDTLLYYFKSIQITINIEEFIIQFNSHPDFPALLAISDTLTFFKIDNAAFRISKEQLPDLPNDFICQIKTPDGNRGLIYVRQKNNGFEVYNNDKFEIKTVQEFESVFDGIVLLAEKSEQFIPTNSNNKFSLNNFLVLSLFIVFCSFLGFSHYQYLIYFLTSSLGLFFSVQALKEVFGVESKVLTKVCNSSANVSCASVLKSDKWTLFKKISFSDLSLLFFTVQTVAILFFTSLNQTESFFNLQKIILAISIIPIGASLYYQKMVEKKWCPICLLIITTLLAQMVFIVLTQVTLIITIDTYALIIYALIAICLLTVWLPLKKVLVTQKQLQEDNFKLKRFSRNYELFKNTLVKSNKIDFPANNPIVLGNSDGKLTISIITSMYCGFCKEVNKMIAEILDKNKDARMEVYFRVSVDKSDTTVKNVYQGLVNSYLTSGDKEFMNNILTINEYQNYNLFKDKNFDNLEQTNEILNQQLIFCDRQNLFYTPAIFINGYEYPKVYERSELEFFITELIEDETL